MQYVLLKPGLRHGGTNVLAEFMLDRKPMKAAVKENIEK